MPPGVEEVIASIAGPSVLERQRLGIKFAETGEAFHVGPMKPQRLPRGKAPIDNDPGLGLDHSTLFRPLYPIVMSETHPVVFVVVGGRPAADGTCRNA